MHKYTIKKLLAYLRPYSFLLIVSILLGLINVASNLVLPYLFGKSIDLIVGVNDVNYTKLKTYALYLLIIIFVAAIAQWIMSFIHNTVTYRVIRDIRNNAFTKLEHLPLSYIDSHQTGELVNNIITDTEQLGEGLYMTFTQFFTGVLTILGVIGFMFAINLWISLFVIVLTPLSFIIAKWISKNSYDSFKKQSIERGNQTSMIDEFIGNQKVIQSLKYEDDASLRFEEQNEKLANISLKATFISSLVNPSTRFINAIIYAGVALIGGIIILNTTDVLTIGLLSTLLGYSSQYSKPFNEITGVITELQNALACGNRIFKLLDEVLEIDNGNEVLRTNVGNININNVSFSYTPEQKLIENFNLEVKKGEHIAIVGPTGCGKTTMINLLMRFYDVNKGEILLDGININNLSKQNLREHYGMVLQDTWLKNGTIRENITMNKEYSIEAINDVINKTKLNYLISSLPKGLDTVLSENGGNLSAGQKQLISIARVMLKNSDILILDEATSNIDTRTELIVQNAFLELMQNKTSFIVAHRLSTIKNADKIIVMNNGSIIEIGSHEELLAKKGFYYTLFNAQFQTK